MKINFYYAPSLAHIEFAANNGFKKVVLDSRGHDSDLDVGGSCNNLLCLMREVPQIYNLRKKFASQIIEAKQEVRQRVDFAKSLGLKVYFHSYEVSLPSEVMEVFPELTVGHVSEMLAEDETARVDRYLCLSNPEVRRLIEIKTAESLEDFADIDGFIYSFHESKMITYSHNCDQCKQYPDRFPLIEWLNKAIVAGAYKISSKIEVIPRLWGINHVKGLGGERIEYLADFYNNDHALWYCRRPRSRTKYVYDPEPVNHKLKEYAETNNLSLIYKATWGDYTLNQPLNRWVNQYGSAAQIVELSLEHCVSGRYIPLIISRQHQELIKKTQGENISYAVVPVNWGRICDRKTKEPAAYPDSWSLNKLNLTIVSRLLQNPELDISQGIREELEKQYGIDCGDAFAELLLQTADVMDMAININGISTTMNLDYLIVPANYTLQMFASILLWYAIMHPDWKELIAVDEANTVKIMSRLERAVHEADKLYDRALATISAMDAGNDIKTEFKCFFKDFRDLATILAVSRQRLWTQFTMQRLHQVNYKNSAKLDKLMAEEKRLISGSKYLSDIFNNNLKNISGWK